MISDDGSTDATLEIIGQLNDARVKIVAHEKRKAKYTIDHSTANFENALKHASGNFIFLSDQDDIWDERKTGRMMSELKSYDMVMSDCSVVDENLHMLFPSYYNDVRPFHQSLFHNFIKPSFLGSCMAFRRNVLRRALPFPKYGVAHDLWLGLVGLRFYRFHFIREPLIKYRRHSSTVTAAGKTNNTPLWFKVCYRSRVLCAILKLIF